MCTRKAKIRSLLIFLLSAACLCAGMFLSAPNDAREIAGAYHEIEAGGQTYLLCLDGDFAEIFDLQYKKLCRYETGDEGTVVISHCISDLDMDGTDDILSIAEIGSEDGGPEAIEALVLEEGHERRIVLRLDDDMLIHSYTDNI
jgi:hypothetical protein